MSCKVVLVDMYGGASNVYIATCNPTKLSGLLEDFIFVVGDQLSDADSYSAARKLQVYLRSANVRSKLNSQDLASDLFQVDLKSATIVPSKLVEQYEAVGPPKRVGTEPIAPKKITTPTREAAPIQEIPSRAAPQKVLRSLPQVSEHATTAGELEGRRILEMEPAERILLPGRGYISLLG